MGYLTFRLIERRKDIKKINIKQFAPKFFYLKLIAFRSAKV